jgi:hypothetical protein
MKMKRMKKVMRKERKKFKTGITMRKKKKGEEEEEEEEEEGKKRKAAELPKLLNLLMKILRLWSTCQYSLYWSRQKLITITFFIRLTSRPKSGSYYNRS